MYLTESVLAYGMDAALPASIPLRAGAVSLRFENGALRHIRVGNTLALAQIYAAVRDQNWVTIPLSLTILEQEIQDDHFRLRFQADHHRESVDFGWIGTIIGEPDGSVSFEFEGQSRSAFMRNRIGFCILHPANCAGKAITIKHPDGTDEEGQFPLQIEPYPPYQEIQAMVHEPLPGLRVEVSMEGDIFEMEDQRNWSDASYKTYCTPLRLPYPVAVNPGDRVYQRVSLRFEGTIPPVPASDAPVDLTFDPHHSVPLPAVGLCSASHEEPFSQTAIKRLKELKLSYLRADLQLDKDHDGIESLHRFIHEAETLALPLEFGLYLRGSDPELDETLAAFGQRLMSLKPPVVRWLILDQVARVTPPGLIVKARRHLSAATPEARFVGGTDAYFNHLNRDHAFMPEADGVCYPANPQCHASDNTTLIECSPTLQRMVESARQFSVGKTIHVGPVTLKRRWNPDAVTFEAPPPGELPEPVDPRQMSLIGAGWALGILKYLAHSRCESVTLGETTGWRGVMERAEGSPIPEKFRSLPNGIFPIWYILHAVADFWSGTLTGLDSSDPLRVDGIILRRGSHSRVVLANFSEHSQSARLALSGESYRVQIISTINALALMRDTHAFQAMTMRIVAPQEGVLRLDLPPFALAFLDG